MIGMWEIFVVVSGIAFFSFLWIHYGASFLLHFLSIYGMALRFSVGFASFFRIGWDEGGLG